jgi:multidrug efflux pump subunit AcrB
MAHKSDEELIRTTHNTSRFFVEQPQIAWVLLVAVLVWGIYGYIHMPKRKDPDIPVRQAMVIVPWPGVSAERVEQLVTKRVEQRVAQNTKVTEIRSFSRTGVSVTTLELDENNVKDPPKELDDIKGKLDGIGELPEGAGPVQFIKDFGDTATLMLTVASPPVTDTEIALRAREIEPVLRQMRGEKTDSDAVSIAICFPRELDPKEVAGSAGEMADWLEAKGYLTRASMQTGPGFVLLNGISTASNAVLKNALDQFLREEIQMDELHPDVWHPVIVRSFSGLQERLREARACQYTYRQLEDFTEMMARGFQTLPQVAKVNRTGILPTEVSLTFSRDRLAAYHVNPSSLSGLLQARNVTGLGGSVNSAGQSVRVAPSGEFTGLEAIKDVPIIQERGQAPVYLRDLFSVNRSYQTPPGFLNFLTYRARDGQIRRGRAITLDLQMRAGDQIGSFAQAVDTKLDEMKRVLPQDLVMARTSDQPRQVKENVDLFMTSLWEAVLLVIFISLVGFWEWRSAALMALSIPITLAMTFGMMSALGIDLQQISIASLIIALGLLVDDPVVAGDAMRRDLANGHGRKLAAWLGPTKLSRAILFATVTNIVAYLPFLLLHGDTGRFVFSMPIVITCSLIASRLVSMTFIPLLGGWLLREVDKEGISARKQSRFGRFYYRVGGFAIQHRKRFLLGSLLVLPMGAFFLSQLKPMFFPQDLQYLSYVDLWMPEGASFASTLQASREAEAVIRETARQFQQQDQKREHSEEPVLKTLTTFVGGGGPRFWFSVPPEAQQLNYAQIVIETSDKHDTLTLLPALQNALSAKVPGARIDVRNLETGPPVGAPVSLRISGEDLHTLRTEGEQLKDIFRSIPAAARIRDDWGEDRVAMTIHTDPDRAALAGVTNQDVADTALTSTDGVRVGTLREADHLTPLVLRNRVDERSRLSDLRDLYVFSRADGHRVPLREVARFSPHLEPETIRHFNRFRTMTVSAFPVAGAIPSDVLNAAMPKIKAFQRQLPPGYELIFAGEYREQTKGFADLSMAMISSVIAIYLALVLQFRHALKPLIVFAAIPFGLVGALAALYMMREPFGFTAFLGIASLIGVIVSHIIVLFDFIEERREMGESLQESLLDAGILRLRPVLITVAATAIALIPLASHGGPLWEPLCYAQVGGLLISTLITLLLVPTLYAFVVLDLKWITWDGATSGAQAVAAEEEKIGELVTSARSF